MSPTRRTFLKQLGLGIGGVALLSPGSRAAWAAESLRLPRSTPEAEGISSAGILAFLEALAPNKHELHSFILARHGRVVAEGWWSPYAPELRHTMYSMSKSFTSTAVGLAVAEGKLRVADKVASFFPKDLPDPVSENLAALRVQDLLTMSVGNEKEPTYPMVQEENWVRTFLAAPITHPPGSAFMYNSAATYMCSAIVQKVTGQKVIEYLTPRLFDPLGIEGATWETCPRGINTGGWGLSIQTEGLAKFGNLYLQKGVWQGREILPAKWVEEATSFYIQQPDPAKPVRPKEQNDWLQGYGYQFWRCQHGGFRGDGAFGQFTIVLPEQDAVLAMTGEDPNMQGELDLVWEHLLPAMKAAPLPSDPALQTLATNARFPGADTAERTDLLTHRRPHLGKKLPSRSQRPRTAKRFVCFSKSRLPLHAARRHGGAPDSVRPRKLAARRNRFARHTAAPHLRRRAAARHQTQGRRERHMEGREHFRVDASILRNAAPRHRDLQVRR